MDHNIPLGYTEELSFPKLTANQLLTAAREAAEKLHWMIVQIGENYLVSQTPAGTSSFGEFVNVQIVDNKAYLQIIPINEYYWNTEQNQSIATVLKETIASLLPDLLKSERSKHPMHREPYGALLLSKTYKATPLIVYSLALIYLVMILAGVHPINPEAKDLFNWGGNFRNAVMDGQWWRLITSTFLHAGFLHMIMNVFALLYVGMFLEPVIGKSRLLFAYFLTGIMASLASILMHPFSVGVGASGAIFGLYGVFFSLLTTGYFQKTARKTMLRSLLFFIVFNLLMGLQGNTDNAAHVGGLVSGILIGYLFYPSIKKAIEA